MADMEKKDITSISGGGGDDNEEEHSLLEGMSVLDFDMLCATVALQAQQGGFSSKEAWEKLGDEVEFGNGVQRMWEGEILDCLQDRHIAFQTACCPCYRFGKNMRRAGFGSCIIHGIVYLILVVSAIFNYVAYAFTSERGFLYLALVLTISSGMYLGFFRRQMRKQFNIGGGDNSLDDCVNHLICPCCTLCQESRTLEINNVQDGVWRGRGDTICIGSYGEGSKGFVELRQPHLIQTISPDSCTMQRVSDGSNHSWNVDMNQSASLVTSNKL